MYYIAAVQNSAKLRVLFWQASFEIKDSDKKKKRRKKKLFFHEKPCVKFTLEPQLSDGIRSTSLKKLAEKTRFRGSF